MSERAAVDASPLVFLGNSGLFDLLRLAADEVVVPDPVWEEVMRKRDDAARLVATSSWLKRAPPAQVPPEIRSWGLDAGESSVLAVAFAARSTGVVLDDLAARRCGLSLGLDVTGTLGLVLRGHLRGLVEAGETLRRLRAGGMWLSDAVVERALRTLEGPGRSLGA